MAFTAVKVELKEGAGQVRDEAGQFTSQVELGTSAAASNAARRGAALARGMYASTGLGWAVNYAERGGGGHSDIVGSGQWVEAAEEGIPAHRIAPHDPDTALANEGDDFGPILPPGTSVEWKPKKAIPHHIVERAGDQIAAEFEAILVSFLP